VGQGPRSARICWCGDARTVIRASNSHRCGGRAEAATVTRRISSSPRGPERLVVMSRWPPPGVVASGAWPPAFWRRWRPDSSNASLGPHPARLARRLRGRRSPIEKPLTGPVAWTGAEGRKKKRWQGALGSDRFTTSMGLRASLRGGGGLRHGGVQGTRRRPFRGGPAGRFGFLLIWGHPDLPGAFWRLFFGCF